MRSLGFTSTSFASFVSIGFESFSASFLKNSGISKRSSSIFFVSFVCTSFASLVSNVFNSFSNTSIFSIIFSFVSIGLVSFTSTGFVSTMSKFLLTTFSLTSGFIIVSLTVSSGVLFEFLTINSFVLTIAAPLNCKPPRTNAVLINSSFVGIFCSNAAPTPTKAAYILINCVI